MKGVKQDRHFRELGLRPGVRVCVRVCACVCVCACVSGGTTSRAGRHPGGTTGSALLYAGPCLYPAPTRSGLLPSRVGR